MKRELKSKKAIELVAPRSLLISGFEFPVSFVVAILVRSDAVSDRIEKRGHPSHFRNCIR
jgi:hypothetical protein